MTPEQQRVYESIEVDAAGSRLEPHRDVILRWRREDRSYRRIQRALAAHGVTITLSALYKFVKLRARPRTADAGTTPVERIQPDAQPERKPMGSSEENLRPRRSPEEISAMRKAASAAHHKPAFPMPDAPKPWAYDPDRPLTNIKPTTKDTTRNGNSRSNRNPKS